MTNYIFIENGIITGCGNAPLLNENAENIEVNDEVYNNFIADRLKYIYQNNKIIPNPNYQELKRKQEAQEEIQTLKNTLEELDKKRIRAICENEVKDETTNETWLDYYNNEIAEIRQRIVELSQII